MEKVKSDFDFEKRVAIRNVLLDDAIDNTAANGQVGRSDFGGVERIAFKSSRTPSGLEGLITTADNIGTTINVATINNPTTTLDLLNFNTFDLTLNSDTLIQATTGSNLEEYRLIVRQNNSQLYNITWDTNFKFVDGLVPNATLILEAIDMFLITYLAPNTYLVRSFPNFS